MNHASNSYKFHIINKVSAGNKVYKVLHLVHLSMPNSYLTTCIYSTYLWSPGNIFLLTLMNLCFARCNSSPAPHTHFLFAPMSQTKQQGREEKVSRRGCGVTIKASKKSHLPYDSVSSIHVVHCIQGHEHWMVQYSVHHTNQEYIQTILMDLFWGLVYINTLGKVPLVKDTNMAKKYSHWLPYLLLCTHCSAGAW